MTALTTLAAEVDEVHRLCTSLLNELDDARTTIARLERQHDNDLTLIRDQRVLIDTLGELPTRQVTA